MTGEPLQRVGSDLLRQDVSGRFSRTSPVTLPVDPLRRFRRGEPLKVEGPAARSLRRIIELLERAYGVQGGASERPLRRAPSAGGLYPTEVLLLVWERRWRTLYYHFESRRVFALPRTECDAASAGAILGLQPEECGVLLLSVLWRTVQRYNVRGHRYCLLDAGTVADNLLVACELRHGALGLTPGAPTIELEVCLGLRDGEALVEAFACRLPGRCIPSSLDDPSAVPRPAPDSAVEAPPGLSPSLRRAVDLHRRGLVAHRRASKRLSSGGPKSVALLRERRSVKAFSPNPLPRAMLEQVFVAARDARPWRRQASRLCARCAVVRVEGCRPGIYEECDGQLVLLRAHDSEDLARALQTACQGQALLSAASFTLFLWVERSTVDAGGALGYRHTALNAGLICARLYRLATASCVGTTTIGGFSDEAVAALLSKPSALPLVGQAFGTAACEERKLDADTRPAFVLVRGDRS